METLTTCSICFNRYSQSNHVPLVLTCGHTFCKDCVSRVTKCPLCRKIISSTTTNLIIFQISCTNGGHCEHKHKRLFCPNCACSICIACVPAHNMHGIIPFTDASLSGLINEKLNNANEKLNDTNKSLKSHYEKIANAKQKITEKEFKIFHKIKKKFECIFQYLTIKKQEILDEVACFYMPISSKLDTLMKELDGAIENNEKEIKFIEEIKKIKIKAQIEKMRSFKVKFINPNLIEKIIERSKKLPKVSIEIDPILNEIKNLKCTESEKTKSFLGFKYS